MTPLSSDHLESIQHLLVEPLREAVRAEMSAGHERLADVLRQMGERLDGYIERTDRRLVAAERDIARLRAFRHRVVAIYSTLSVIASMLWSFMKDKLISR